MLRCRQTRQAKCMEVYSLAVFFRAVFALYVVFEQNLRHQRVYALMDRELAQ